MTFSTLPIQIQTILMIKIVRTPIENQLNKMTILMKNWIAMIEITTATTVKIVKIKRKKSKKERMMCLWVLVGWIYFFVNRKTE